MIPGACRASLYIYNERMSINMARVVAGINMTIDGYCDHTAVTPDDEIHDHYTQLIRDADVIMWGRITYLLMETYWPGVALKPTGNKATDDFAAAAENIQKIAFSNTLKRIEWRNARLANESLENEVLELKRRPGNDILIGSPSLILECTRLKLIDEYQLCIHPVIVGSGLPLFKGIDTRSVFRLIKTKTFRSGAVIHFYEPSA